jgi:hypothetical protein
MEGMFAVCFKLIKLKFLASLIRFYQFQRPDPQRINLFRFVFGYHYFWKMLIRARMAYIQWFFNLYILFIANSSIPLPLMSELKNIVNEMDIEDDNMPKSTCSID